MDVSVSSDSDNEQLESDVEGDESSSEIDFDDIGEIPEQIDARKWFVCYHFSQIYLVPIAEKIKNHCWSILMATKRQKREQKLTLGLKKLVILVVLV